MFSDASHVLTAAVRIVPHSEFSRIFSILLQNIWKHVSGSIILRPNN